MTEALSSCIPTFFMKTYSEALHFLSGPLDHKTRKFQRQFKHAMIFPGEYNSLLVPSRLSESQG